MESLALVAVLREQWTVKRPCPFPDGDQGEQEVGDVREPDVDEKMGLCLMLARQTRCPLKFGAVVAELGKVVKDGHLRVVTVTWAHQVKNSSRLRKNRK